MSLFFNGSVMVPAAPGHVWPLLVDWVGQERWIPLTTMRLLSDRAEGLGAKIRGEHGFRLGGRRVGFTDEMVVTRWEPPYELEMTHLGPWFTGVGVFTIEARGRRSWLSIRERITLPGGKAAKTAALAIRPALQRQLASSLERFASLVEARTPRPSRSTDPAERYLAHHAQAAVFADEEKKRRRRQERRRMARS